MSAPGNRAAGAPIPAGAAGFSLLELLLVVALIAVASAGVVFATRSSGEQLLEREALRLVAHLEAARAESRATGQVIVWRPDDTGYAFAGPSARQPPAAAWMEAGTTVDDGTPLVLGPEPIIGPQQIVLRLGAQSLRVGTDGLRPFALLPVDDASPSEGSPP